MNPVDKFYLCILACDFLVLNLFPGEGVQLMVYNHHQITRVFIIVRSSTRMYVEGLIV